MEFLLISTAIASISVTITCSSLFKPIRNLRIPFLGKIINCSYCLNHYLAFGAALIRFDSLFNFIIESFAMVTIASILSSLLVTFLEKLDE